MTIACHVKVHDNPRDRPMLSYVMMVSPHRNDTLSGTKVAEELCGSEGSPTLTFWVFIHLQRILQTHQEYGGAWKCLKAKISGCDWKVWGTGMKGWDDAYLRFLSLLYDHWLYVFLHVDDRNILGTTKKLQIGNSTQESYVSLRKNPQDQMRASELRSSGGNNFSQAEVDELSILFNEGLLTDEFEQWLKTSQLLLVVSSTDWSQNDVFLVVLSAMLQTLSVWLFGVTLLY